MSTYDPTDPRLPFLNPLPSKPAGRTTEPMPPPPSTMTFPTPTQAARARRHLERLNQGQPAAPAGLAEPAWELPRSLPLGEALRLQRRMRGVSLDELAKGVGCAKSYLSQIENGYNGGMPDDDLLGRVERALGMRRGDLTERSAWRSAPDPIKQHVARLTKRDRATQHLAALINQRGLDDLYRSGELKGLVDQLSPPPLEPAPEPPEHPQAGFPPPRYPGAGLDTAPVDLPMDVPLINSVAAGYPRGFTDLGYPARIADSYIRSPDVRDPDAFACRVVGDSMEPEYREGDVVIFSPSKGVKDGSDCFVRLERDAETTFKRVFFEREQEVVVRIRLQPLNKRHATRTFAREDVAGLYPAVSVTRPVG